MNLLLPFEFSCTPVRPTCLTLMLPFLIHSKFNVSRCLFALCSLRFTFLWSIRISVLETTTQFGSGFKIKHFSMSRPSMTFLNVLVVESLVPT